MKKHAWYLVTGLLFALKAYSTFYVHEGYLIIDQIQNWRPFLAQHPELTIDNVRAHQFEIHGPPGLNDLLSNLRTKHNFGQQHFNLQEGKSWPTPEQIGPRLQELAAKYPHLCQLFSLGKTEMQREIWALKISAQPLLDQLQPEIKFMANMHGDEMLGRDLLITFIADLLASYGNDPQITNLINQTETFFVPSINPDGAARFQRGNQQYIDLNRDFPAITDYPDLTRSPVIAVTDFAIETQLIMKWQQQRHFAFSANFHGGSIVANYPWDTISTPHANRIFLQALANSYAGPHPIMSQSREFPHGIVQGSDWYTISGSMQDWSTYFYQDLQLTIELSDPKIPPYQQLPKYYQQNRSSLLAFWQMAQRGIGFVTPHPQDQAQLSLEWHPPNRPANQWQEIRSLHFTGEIYLPLLPGDYRSQIFLELPTKASTQKISFTITNTFTTTNNYIYLSI